MPKPRIDDDFLSDGADSITDDDLEHILEQAEVITAKADKMLSLGEQVLMLLGMLYDYITGAYITVPLKTIGAIVFSLLYVLNPIDLVPDILPGLGFLDDALLVTTLLSWARTDIERYCIWREKNAEEPPVTASKKQP